MRALLLLLPAILLAGCAQLDDAKQAASDAQQAIDDARREAEEAKARYDRVKSATVVRTERADLTLLAQGNDTHVWFDAQAERGEVPIPDENLTDLPDVTFRGSEWSFTCDPLSCSARLPVETILVTWADGAPGEMTLSGGRATCGPEQSAAFCLPTLSREDAEIVVTTALGDVTE